MEPAEGIVEVSTSHNSCGSEVEVELRVALVGRGNGAQSGGCLSIAAAVEELDAVGQHLLFGLGRDRRDEGLKGQQSQKGWDYGTYYG